MVGAVVVVGEFRGEKDAKDDGIPFNSLLREPPDTSLAAKDRKIGGLGIHLVRSMTDDIRYEHHTDQNTLTLIIGVDVPNERS